METQWQRALEMISTGPDDDAADRHHSTKKNSTIQRDALAKGNEVYETPVNNRHSKKCDDGPCGDDKLQSFIDMVNFARFLLYSLRCQRFNANIISRNQQFC